MEEFSEYAFNKSIDENCIIPLVDGTNKKLKDVNIGDLVHCFDGKKMVPTEVVNIHDHGILEGIEVTFDDGHKETCSINHKFLTSEGMIPLSEILARNLEVMSYEKNSK